jgi:hypothetical protein
VHDKEDMSLRIQAHEADILRGPEARSAAHSLHTNGDAFISLENASSGDLVWLDRCVQQYY